MSRTMDRDAHEPAPVHVHDHRTSHGGEEHQEAEAITAAARAAGGGEKRWAGVEAIQEIVRLNQVIEAREGECKAKSLIISDLYRENAQLRAELALARAHPPARDAGAHGDRGSQPADSHAQAPASARVSPRAYEELRAAARTLEDMNYTWSGGPFWRPPLGKPPEWVPRPELPGLTGLIRPESDADPLPGLDTSERFTWLANEMMRFGGDPDPWVAHNALGSIERMARRLADIGPHKGERVRGYEEGVQKTLSEMRHSDARVEEARLVALSRRGVNDLPRLGLTSWGVALEEIDRLRVLEPGFVNVFGVLDDLGLWNAVEGETVADVACRVIKELHQDVAVEREARPSWQKIASIIGVSDTDDVEQELRELKARDKPPVFAADSFKLTPVPEFEPGRTFSIRVTEHTGYERYTMIGAGRFQLGELLVMLRHVLRHIESYGSQHFIPMLEMAENDQPRR